MRYKLGLLDVIRYGVRLGAAVVVAVLACAVTVGILLVLPPSVSLAVMFVGLGLFCFGAKVGYRWPAAVGGVLMFSGVFAAALLGAIK